MQEGVYVDGRKFEYSLDGAYDKDGTWFDEKASIRPLLDKYKSKIKAILERSSETCLVLMEYNGKLRFMRLCAQGTMDANAYVAHDKGIICSFLDDKHFVGDATYGPTLFITRHRRIVSSDNELTIGRHPKKKHHAVDVSFFAGLDTDCDGGGFDVCPVCFMQKSATGKCDCDLI